MPRLSITPSANFNIFRTLEAPATRNRLDVFYPGVGSGLPVNGIRQRFELSLTGV
jgi:hypothetical protein